MENRFAAEFIVDYYGIKPDCTISFPRLMAYMQEASIRHTDSTSYPMKWYSENRFAFLLTNWHVEAISYPGLHDKITIHTWPICFKGIISERYFEMRDINNKILARAASKWAYMDLERKRPRKPPEEIVSGYGGAYPPGFTHSYGPPVLSDEFDKTGTDHFKITRRDIDSNNHVNNVKYIEWAVDYIPDAVYDSYSISEAKVSYKKECVKDQLVFIETYANLKNSPEVVSLLKPEEDPGGLLAEVYFKFG